MDYLHNSALQAMHRAVRYFGEFPTRNGRKIFLPFQMAEFVMAINHPQFLPETSVESSPNSGSPEPFPSQSHPSTSSLPVTLPLPTRLHSSHVPPIEHFV